ncbi:transposable element Tcb1 transposase [Trichonephila clavipes]|nr:transposable element Tcb1 transposase [Trichonephila clavipes]
MWFQHDVALAHFSTNVRTPLNTTFGARCSECGVPVPWPLQSPDISSLDYFLWGHLKNLVYATPLDANEDLIARISETAARVSEIPDTKLNSSQILKQWTLTSNVSVCPRTVRGRLLEIGLRGCKARPKPLLTQFQRKRRLTWAMKHSLWTIKDWEKVIFSGESQFCISGNQSSAYVRRRTHEEFSPQCLKPTVKYLTKVMVWGCMSSHGVGRLHIVSGTVKAMDYIEILQNKLLPTARDFFGNQSWIFQDDNVPWHRAKVVQKRLKDNTVNRMNWPGQSPDLNPIENLWFKIGYEISKQKPSNKLELIEASIFSFNHIVSRKIFF